MTNQDLQKFIVTTNYTVSETMQRIDANTSGIVFVVDDIKTLVGCVTDGDIRRFLLSGGLMTDDVIKAANKVPKKATSRIEAEHLYHKKNFVVIPIVNDDGIIVDLYAGEDNQKKDKIRNSIKIPVVINAGGKGTRLDPYTRVLPKPLIPIGDMPIIEHIMKEYQSYECNDFHIIVNYKKDLMKAYFADVERSYNITWYDEEKPLGTGGGLSLLRGKFNSTFFFANCDALLTANYESMVKFHKENGNLVTMVCAYKNMNIPYGIIEMGVNGSIEEMKEKPLVSFLTNTGIYIVEPDVIDSIEDDEAIGFPDVIKRIKDNGGKVAAYPVSENDWMDMGQLPELEKMRIRLYGE